MREVRWQMVSNDYFGGLLFFDGRAAPVERCGSSPRTLRHFFTPGAAWTSSMFRTAELDGSLRPLKLGYVVVMWKSGLQMRPLFRASLRRGICVIVHREYCADS